MADILYTTIDGENVFEFEEKRSVFIGYAKSVSTEAEAKEFIQRIKSKHYDARHNCSAFLLRNGQMKYSDDGEPQGTAGIPILEVIKKSGLVDIVVVVTRYFGGILLGAGGLVRAYSAGAAGALNNAVKAEFQKCVQFMLEIDYSLYDKISRILSNNGVRVINTDYAQNIIITAVIPTFGYKLLCNQITESFSGKIDSIYIDEIIEKI